MVPPSSTIPGLGPVDVTPIANREFDPAGLEMTPHDYFVLTRCDGRTSFKLILQMTGFAEDATIAILKKLREAGAILLPGEAPPPRRLRVQPPASRAPATEPPRARPPSTQPASHRQAPSEPQDDGRRPARGAKPPSVPPASRAASTPPSNGRPPPVLDERILAEVVDLSMEQKRTILSKHLSLAGGSLFDVLDVGPDADKKALKRAYFRISKDFHPDRFYGKQLGSYQARLGEIFKASTDAFEILEDDQRRAGYLARLMGTAAPSQGNQTPADRAAELFEQACQHEIMGNMETALKEFAAAIRLDPQTRYLKRAALASLRAQELSSAEEYATKAAEIDPRDGTAHRTLAKVFRAVGRAQDALRELELANRLDPDNPHIAAELDEIRAEVQRH